MEKENEILEIVSALYVLASKLEKVTRTDVEEVKEEPAVFEKKQYKAKCAMCGQDTTVPFKPRNNSALYCKSCYYKKKEEEDARSR